jgi:hypothetical protein
MPGSQPLASNEGPAADLPEAGVPSLLTTSYVSRRWPPASPTEIPQVRLPGRPHRHPTDTAAFRGTPRHSC